MKASDRVSSIVLLILSLLVCLGASRLHIGSFKHPGSGFVPFLLGTVIGFLSLLILIKSTFGKRDIKGEPKLWSSAEGVKKVFYVLVGLVSYGLLLERLGHLITTFLLFILLLRGINPQKWYITILGALFASVGSYAIFQLGLKVQLPKGFWGM
jgi:presenilin-like A22 family membrane protease